MEKYLDLARELKKLWKMKVTVGLFGLLFKNLEKRREELGLEEKLELSRPQPC